MACGCSIYDLQNKITNKMDVILSIYETFNNVATIFQLLPDGHLSENLETLGN